MKKPKKTTKKLSKRNSKILYDTMVTLGALKEANRLHDMPMHEIQVHLLDKDGDGIVLSLEYDELTGELNKTFYSVDEYYATEESEDVEMEELDSIPHFYGEHEDLDSCISPENIKTRFEEVISEEYDEIFQERNSNDDEEPLLN